MMKVWKKVCSVILAGMLLAGCADWHLLAVSLQSNDTNIIEKDQTPAEEKAEKIMENLGLADKMAALKERNMRSLVFQGDEIYSDGVIYLSTEQKSDSVGVFYVTDFDKALSHVEEYLSSLKTQTNVYDFSEMFKISNAVVADNGTDLIVMIICSDIEEAKKLAEEAVRD